MKMLLTFITALLVCAGQATARGDSLELQAGDHVCIVGNTLAERMQYFGWLETLIHARFPKHELVFRNLGYSGDELELGKRLRSMDFGTPDQWLSASAPIPQPAKLDNTKDVKQNRFELTNTKADVILAFFGYNESFAGADGIEQFKQELEKYIEHTLSQKYNGKSAPRLVLFSPIAHEDLHDRNLPDGAENNARLQLYTTALAEVAASKKVPFVDVFTPSRQLYAKADKPLTINGVHLNERGDAAVARVIVQALFGGQSETADLEPLRKAVNDKNFFWFNRYRVTDGYSTYGDRAFLKFTDRQSNYEVAQRELEVLDTMTSNRDQRVWAMAQGRDVTVNDDNTPPFIPVTTNKPGPLEGGKHKFLGGEEAISLMTVHKGLKVGLFASEEQFPELINPVQMAFDTRNRLWVATWPNYPHWRPKDAMNDRLLILEDRDNDGKADKCITFADNLHNPSGFEFWGGGVIVANPPNLLFLKDTDGDDRADVRVTLLHGLDTADTHHAANSFTFDPGGALYFQEGTFHHSQVESCWGPAQRVANGAVFRYEPRSQKFGVYVSFGFANPHGHAFDRWGQDVVVDGTGAVPYHGALFSGHMDFPSKHTRPPQVYQQRTRPCSGVEFLSSRHFPADMNGNLVVPNVIGFQGILRYKIGDEDSSLNGTELEPIVFSSDPNFRPADLETAPDGTLYFTDWQNPIIGHMQHNLRDPSRDRIHGRVYRVTCEDKQPLQPAAIAGEPIAKLLDLLKQPEDRVRYRAKLELSSRPTDDVIAALTKWIAALDPQDTEYQHHLLEGLWVHQHHNVVNQALLQRLLVSPDFRARAAATRVLCYWRDRVPTALPLLKTLAADAHPRVRLEAVRAASFFTEPDAVEVALVSADLPSDKYLDVVRHDAMKTLEKRWKALVDKGETVAVTTGAGARFFLKSLALDKLQQQPRNRAVCLELLNRPRVPDAVRRDALKNLAKLEGKTELKVLLDIVVAPAKSGGESDESVIFDQLRLLTNRGPAELQAARAELESLALTAPRDLVRQIAFVSLINIDKSTEPAWNLATKSVNSLLDLVNAMPLIGDTSLRASLYPRVEPLLKGLPAPLASATHKPPGVAGRFVRIELKGKKTLTLAEVEVYRGSANVAPRGKASQKNTGFGGSAPRAIDGKRDGVYGQGTSTHTEEDTSDPWWEVDLGEEMPISRIVVYNRTDGDYYKRLDQFTLRILDQGRKDVYRSDKNPAPAEKAIFAIGSASPEEMIRFAAMNALTSVRGEEAKTFSLLAPHVREDSNRAAAMDAIQRIPRSLWPQKEAEPLLESVLEQIRRIPVADRTTPLALDSIEFADALASFLPVDQAKRVRAELGELGVRVVRVNTLPERMSYDKDSIVVQVGKPVEFAFENSDLMPHNFVILQPGALVEVGELAEATATQPSAIERQYVPKSSKILLASRMLQPRESQRLSFSVPAQPGIYPYVCTYPGHWRRMYGALYVVQQLDDYLANPEAYLAAHPLPVKDDMLKERRPRTEWKLADLADPVERMDQGRNYGNGKQMFTVANCVGCHKLDGVGNVFGPDLSKLDPKWTTVDILKHILDPSVKIDDKYASYVIEMKSGKVQTGMILEETDKSIKLIENPLANAQPLELSKADIEARQKSPTSIMPKGMLDKLTQDEVLDLIAYLAARGDRAHALFRASDHDH